MLYTWTSSCHSLYIRLLTIYGPVYCTAQALKFLHPCTLRFFSCLLIYCTILLENASTSLILLLWSNLLLIYLHINTLVAFHNISCISMYIHNKGVSIGIALIVSIRVECVRGGEDLQTNMDPQTNQGADMSDRWGS